MRLFGKAGNKSGWLALILTADGVQAVAIERRTGSQPRVQLAQSYTAPSGYPGSILFRVARDLHAANYHCTTLLGSGGYQLLMVEAPNVPAAEMKAALGWRVKDMIDFPLEDATLDMALLPPSKNSSAASSQAFAVVARNSILAPHQQVFWENKVALDAIDIDEMAQRNISALLEPEGRGVAMLSFDADGGLLTVSFNGELYLARRMDITLNQLLETDADRLQHLHDRITLELQRSLDHFERQFSFVAIAKLVLTPVGNGELRNYLAANLYLPVEQLELSSVLELDDVPDLEQAEQQRVYLRAIGAALRTGVAA
ncbi:agglutinin biogenesis protein MshI [Duganella qianjiadongensis]|uniref:Agglutinin biogenesis protein MshI n=1 Tax=Duganella qianjiadongensis TaxID=2692176 RepID=A0ABW9VNB0_9BURK|nr:agglutinin biogenesis protein MshI [Duganella qianjiadongensis]MYM39908.1 agglutinin biogenesis protein MshI [Duganella qianjiadongensis]